MIRTGRVITFNPVKGYGFLRPYDSEVRAKLGSKDLFFAFSDAVLPSDEVVPASFFSGGGEVLYILGIGRTAKKPKAIHWTLPKYRERLEIYDRILEQRIAEAKAARTTVPAARQES